MDVRGNCVHQWAIGAGATGWAGRCQVCGLCVVVEVGRGGRSSWEWAYPDGAIPSSEVMLDGISSVMAAYRGWNAGRRSRLS